MSKRSIPDVGLDDPEEIEAGMHVLLMKSSGSIGYRKKIFMKTVDGMARQQLLNRISWRDPEEDPSSPARWEDYQRDL
jgi:hypothetical protein